MNWDGLLLINKPQGATSHDIVQVVKNRLKATKAGHLGTLDPLATGVFPVCLGKATRLAPFYMKADKTYITAVQFGYFTTTDDSEGEQEGPRRPVRFTRPKLEEMLQQFQGNYLQTPPAYSAKKTKGQRAYTLARRGIKPDLPQQEVQVHEIKLLHFEKNEAIIYIHCGSGTYIRSIARDLGGRMNCGAHVRELTRTKFGVFDLNHSCEPDSQLTQLQACFTPVEKMLTHLPEVVMDAQQCKKILTGASIDLPAAVENDWVRLFDEQHVLLAFGQVQPQQESAPHRVFPKIVFN